MHEGGNTPVRVDGGEVIGFSRVAGWDGEFDSLGDRAGLAVL